MNFWADLLLVFCLILLSGVFAAAELALLSLRESQIDQIELKGKRGRKVAKVARDPNRFLSAAQIGVTFISFFSASYGAATLAPYVQKYLFNNSTLTLVILTIFISYLSLVFGELVPKRLAIQKTEPIAMSVAVPLDAFARLVRPVIWILSKSTNIVFRLIGGDPSVGSNDDISEEELQSIVETHDTLEDEEKRILSDVIEAGNRSVAEVMRPRADVVFIDGDLTLKEAAEFVQNQPYSRYPVIGEDFDDVIGFIHVRDVLDPAIKSKSTVKVSSVVRKIIKFPGTNQLFPALTQMRAKGVHIAIVLDEYGGTDGICTLEDMIEELIGEIRDEYDVHETENIRSGRDGSFSIDGGMSLNDFEDATGIEIEDGPYETVAGYVLSRLGKIASVGDCAEIFEVQTDEENEQDFELKPLATLTVTKIDGMRIARLKVRKISDNNEI